jgi:hypothetical protein
MFLDLSLNDQVSNLVRAGAVIDLGTSKTEVVLPGLSDDGEDVVISMITSEEQRDNASALINRMYEWRGYGSHHRLSKSSTQTSFSVSAGGVTIGTLTLTVDSDAGLTTDKTFQSELDTYRRMPGARICELTRFAFDAPTPSKRVLAALFHVIFIYGQRKYGCSDLFIEVAQRHRRFYEAMLSFERVCALKTNDNVGVPSQLMRLNVADIQTHIDAHAGSADQANSRSLYSHFLSKDEANRVFAELAGAIYSIDVPALPTEPDYITFEVVPSVPVRARKHARVRSIVPPAEQATRLAS